jgi:hypothetical protein
MVAGARENEHVAVAGDDEVGAQAGRPPEPVHRVGAVREERQSCGELPGEGKQARRGQVRVPLAVVAVAALEVALIFEGLKQASGGAVVDAHRRRQPWRGCRVEYEHLERAQGTGSGEVGQLAGR